MVIALVLLVVALMGTAWEAGRWTGRRDASNKLTEQAEAYQQTIDTMTEHNLRDRRLLIVAQDTVQTLTRKVTEKERKIAAQKKKDFHRKPQRFYPPPAKPTADEELRFRGTFKQPKKR